jgi:hypothetical protein
LRLIFGLFNLICGSVACGAGFPPALSASSKTRAEVGFLEALHFLEFEIAANILIAHIDPVRQRA